jgi:NADH-quinone oxidoreductase subunit D
MAEIALVQNPHVGLTKAQENKKYVNDLTTLNLSLIHI